MAQQNEQNHSFDPVTVPVKRKRGRPRKEDVPGTEPSGRTQRRRRNPPPTTGPGLVGQPVSGTLDGVFDAGFFITVRVGNSGPLLKGMVFDSRLCIPISAANDVAPHIKMLKREEIPIPVPIPAELLQRRGPNVPSPTANKGMVNDGSQESALKLKLSEAVISGAHSTVAKEAAVVSGVHSTIAKEATVTVQVPDNQRQGLTEDNETAGKPKLDSTSKASQGNETAGEPKLGSISRTTPGNEVVGELKLDSTSKASLDNEAAGEPKLDCAKQTNPGNEAAGGPKVDCVSQTRSTDQMPPANVTECEHKLRSASQIPPVNETVEEPMLESTSQILPEPHGPAPVPEPDSKNAEIQNDADQVRSGAAAAGTQPLALQNTSEVLQETKKSNWC